ncbi:MAG: SRPBCC family protein [Eubacteriales bacterium]|jgi:uncharacterized protein YndB with AHSA1/START domain
MSVNRVQVTDEIRGELEKVFQWFYHSENFTKSPIVFRSKWRPESTRWCAGSVRDINMIAGWYQEEITEVKENEYIRYRVNNSFPKVKQDFTEIRFENTPEGTVRVTWTIEIEVPGKLGSKLDGPAGKMAGTLYGTIIRAGKKQIEAA